MMAAIVDNNLGDKLKREDITVLLRHAEIAGSWYLNGPADSTDSAEDIGCNWNVHITIDSIVIHINFSDQSIDVRRFKIPPLVQGFSTRLAALGAARYRGYFCKAEICKCKQQQLTVLKY